VDLEIQAGEFCVITGPSGSGKTTLLNLAALLDVPTRGHLAFEGESIGPGDTRRAREIRRERIGMIFQQFHLLPHRSVLDNVRFRFRYLKDEARDRADAVLDELGLSAVKHQKARLLSGGEMQRVAIARALVHPPRLIVADEPTGNLDAATVADVMRAMAQLHGRGIAVLLVTHNPALLPYATRHLVCEDGGIHEAVPA